MGVAGVGVHGRGAGSPLRCALLQTLHGLFNAGHGNLGNPTNLCPTSGVFSDVHSTFILGRFVA